MRRLGACAAAVLGAVCLLATPAQALAGPQYDIKASWGDTDLPLGGTAMFTLQVRNIGDEAAEKAFAIVDQLPAGVKVTHIEWNPYYANVDGSSQCSGVGTETASCVIPKAKAALLPLIAPPPNLKDEGAIIRPEPSGYLTPIFIEVEIEANAPLQGTNVATVSGGGGEEASDVDAVSIGVTPAPFEIVPGSFEADVFEDAYPGKTTARLAGDHPFEQRFNFDISAEDRISGVDGTRLTPPNGSLRTVAATLPRGLIGNPEAVPKCNPLRFAQTGVVSNSTRCPSDTQVGYVNVRNFQGENNHGNAGVGNASALVSRVPIYNLVPPRGTPVDLAFNANGVVQAHIYATLDPAENYAIKAVTPNVSSIVGVLGSEVTIWGVPGDPAHDRYRYFPEANGAKLALGAPFGSTIRPFYTNPMDCGAENGGAQMIADTYQHPGDYTPIQEDPSPLNVTKCDDSRFRFEPEVSLQPTDRHAGAPTGLDVHLEVPQRNDEATDAKELYAEEGFVKGISTPPIKKAVVTLPEGMTLNPSAAQGLGSCSAAQIGLGTDSPVACPDNSQYGTLTLHTPALPADAQPEGFIYIAKQKENPFGSFLALYLVIEEPKTGILVKLPGKAELNSETGQIKTTFDELPQFPVSDMQLTFNGGVRAALVEPATCGKKTIRAEFFSWQDPGAPRVVEKSYDVTERPKGGRCVNGLGERPFGPQLEAGTTNNLAGTYSPFVMRLTRTDEDQEFSQLGITLPQGLAAKFAGVSICSDAGIAQAENRTAAGQGALEQAQPSCPASSQIGTTAVGAGVGVPLTYVGGKVYLSGPYKGAPMSIVVISPAVVGPYDLGVIAVRTALRVDPVTAQGSALSDPFPQIFQGIPVRIRDIRLNLDRPGFTLNPTSCAEKKIDAHVTGTGGDIHTTVDDTGAQLSNRFQAADCASLGFHPHLAFRLFGGTGRGGHPRLRATVTYPKYGAYSNVAAASVALPHSEFLDQGHIKTVCTRVQFAANACPAASIYGHAAAKSPLFDFPLEGPVYLRSSNNRLPDVVAALKGPAWNPVEVDLDGRVDSVNGGIRSTFELVPDAPVEFFTLSLQGAKKGLLENSTDLCAKKYRATAKFKAQNGRQVLLHPVMKASCAKADHGKRRSRSSMR